MRSPWTLFAPGLFVAAMTAAPMAHADVSLHAAVPGTLNYVEGQVSLDGAALNAQSVGKAQAGSNETLATETGKAEMLLTPGVFFRLGPNSQATMVSPSLSNTEVALNGGEALVEVNEVHPENDLRIVENGATTRLLRQGLYDFDADHGIVRVMDGRAVVTGGQGDVTLKSGWELALNRAGNLIPAKFDKRAFEATDLYRWSSLRSDYLAEANRDAARRYEPYGWYGSGWYASGLYGPGWIGAGWYWDPWYSTYTFIPSTGMFYSPFGWRYDSPPVAYRTHRFEGREYGEYGEYGGFRGHGGFGEHHEQQGHRDFGGHGDHDHDGGGGRRG